MQPLPEEPMVYIHWYTGFKEALKNVHRVQLMWFANHSVRASFIQ